MYTRFVPTSAVLLSESVHAVGGGIGAATAILTGLDAEQLAAEAEALEADRARYLRLARLAGEIRDVVDDLLVSHLGPGEVVQAPSGRVAYRDMVPAGQRVVNEDAILEIADDLPADLHPKRTWKMPSLTSIDNAVRGHRITAAQRDAIVQRPGKVPGIRWRTLQVEEL